jgi:hypothetical protein
LAQIFHRGFNTLSKVSIFGSVFFLVGAGAALAMFIRSAYMTDAGIIRDQPVPFSHQHHVTGLGIDCRYCHGTVETSAYAGMPATKTCMNCHQQIWVGSELLSPVRDSFRTGKSIEWNRIHRLADFAYFDHSVHVNKGVGCVTCHGDVQDMALMRQHGTLLMEWCLECHRDPARFVRPREEVFNYNWKPNNQAKIGKELVDRYEIQSLMNCSTCHR